LISNIICWSVSMDASLLSLSISLCPSPSLAPSLRASPTLQGHCTSTKAPCVQPAPLLSGRWRDKLPILTRARFSQPSARGRGFDVPRRPALLLFFCPFTSPQSGGRPSVPSLSARCSEDTSQQQRHASVSDRRDSFTMSPLVHSLTRVLSFEPEI